IIQLKEERLRIQRIILTMGALGAMLAAIPPEWTPNWGLASWVALTAAIASAFTGWEQLRGLDKILTIYSRVILELTIIRDEWEAIAPHRRTEADFISLVRAAEDVMWAQNMQYISTMQEAITSGQGDEAELVENMLKEGDAMTLDLQSKMLDEARGVLKVASAELGKVVEDSADTVKNMVTGVATTASALQEKVQSTVETELMGVEELVGGGLDQISTETAAIRTTISQTVDTAMDEVAATRQMVATTTQAAATEVQALRTTAQATADTALTEVAATRAALQTTTEHVTTQASAIRETVQNTVTEQAAATRATVEITAATVATEAQAIRETAQETATQQATATRELVEGVSQSLVSETAALRETAQTLSEQVVTEASTVRENVTQTVETVLAPSTGQLREMLEVELAKQTPEELKKAPAESTKRTNEIANESLDALLGEAQTLIDEAADEMKTKMAETVVQQIAEQVTEKKKGERAKREKKEKSDPGGVG
ncbi:MAG: SLATT domain-containing protein, partial [Anaerolineales bacterium]|nr:SLATT domain-containing protein [Anaerolineales bacterium]